MLLTPSEAARDARARKVSEHFEALLERLFGDRVRQDRDFACALWCAMTNVEWSHPDIGAFEDNTFRYMAQLIAEMRDPHDQRKMPYMDWYCCGPDGTVSPEIAEALAAEGWTHAPIPD